MENDKTIEALTEELEYTEDKVIRLESKIKELKEGLKIERERHRHEMERMYDEFRGKKRSGSFKLDYGYIVDEGIRYPEPQQAEAVPEAVPWEGGTFTNEWAPNPWQTTTVTLPEGTFAVNGTAGNTMTVTDVDVNNGTVTLRDDVPATQTFTGTTQQMMNDIARDAMIFGTAQAQVNPPTNPRWVMTQNERVETIVRLLEQGVINEEEGRQILNGEPFFDRVTGERIL